MNKMIFFLLLIVFSITITACKKELSGTATKEYTLEDLEVVPLAFNYLSAKSRIRFQDKSNNISLSATIRIKKDSLIWFSLSPALGIEAVRGIVTQDSVKIMNRLNQVYNQYDFDALSKKFNFEINFGLIQSMLLGDMPFEQSVDDKIVLVNNNFMIHQQAGDVLVDNYINAERMKAERVQLAERSSDNTLTLLYSDFHLFDDVLIPYSNKIILNYQEGKERRTTLIDIDHGKTELANASLEFPFNIPQKYDRK